MNLTLRRAVIMVVGIAIAVLPATLGLLSQPVVDVVPSTLQKGEVLVLTEPESAQSRSRFHTGIVSGPLAPAPGKDRAR